LTYVQQTGTMSQKELREIVKQIRAKGYSVVPAGKHQKVKDKDGKTVYTLPTTPSGTVWRSDCSPTCEEREPLMAEFAISVETAGGIADAEALDRLAEVAYERPELLGLALGLDRESGSLTATFTVEARNLYAAAETGVQALIKSFAAAGIGSRGARVAIEAEDVMMRVSIEREGREREAVPA
jgi:hypothetical protein